MGFCNKQKNKSGQTDNYEVLSNWIDRILEQDLPKGIIAFNFNLYEGSEETYDIQLIGSDEFDEDDGDWACTDYFSTEEDICYIKITEGIENWEEGLNYIKKLVEQYLIEGKKARILKGANAVGIGFVDGNISLIYRAK